MDPLSCCNGWYITLLGLRIPVLNDFGVSEVAFTRRTDPDHTIQVQDPRQYCSHFLSAPNSALGHLYVREEPGINTQSTEKVSRPRRTGLGSQSPPTEIEARRYIKNNLLFLGVRLLDIVPNFSLMSCALKSW